LKHVRKLHQIVTLRLEILLKVIKRLDIRVHTLFLRVGDENHSVDTLKYQFARSVIKDLAGDCVQVKTRLETTDGSEFKRHEVEKQSSIRFCCQTDELASCLRCG